MTTLDQLSFQDADTQDYNVIIETVKGSRNKVAYLDDLKIFKLKGVLPAGASFPYDFGFIPSTLGEDGDPIDVLLLMDEPVFPGCLVPARLIGVIAAEQTEEGETVRNDRLLAVSSVSRTHQSIQDINDLNEHLVTEIEHFFRSYNIMRGAEFKVVGRYGSEQAQKLVADGGQAFKEKENK